MGNALARTRFSRLASIPPSPTSHPHCAGTGTIGHSPYRSRTGVTRMSPHMMAAMPEADSWTLTSSDGYTQVVGTRRSDDPSDHWLFDLTMGYEIPGTQLAGVALAALRLRPTAVIGLVNEIHAFTGLPPIEIEPAAFRHAAELSDSAGDSFDLTFGPLPGVISGATGIGCLTKLARGSFGAQVVFRTDTTSLERFAHDLDRLLLSEPTS
jgi:hypothetical protein